MEEKNSEYYIIRTLWGNKFDKYSDLSNRKWIDSYAAKLDDGKISDIINLNNWRAKCYVYKVEGMIDGHKRFGLSCDFKRHYEASECSEVEGVSLQACSHYAKISTVLKQKIIGKNLEYIQKAAPSITFPPVKYDETDRCCNIEAKLVVINEKEFSEAKKKEQHIIQQTKKLEEIFRKKDERSKNKDVRDRLADKADKLENSSEYAGFYEENHQEEQRAKDLARYQAYRIFSGKTI